MIINKTTVKILTRQSRVKSVIQTSPLEFLSGSFPKIKTLKRDTFSICPKGVKKSAADAVTVYFPLKTEELGEFKNQVQILKDKNFAGLDIVKNLSEKERGDLIESFRKGEAEEFLLVATGNKPAVLLGSMPAKLNHKDFDVISFKRYVPLPSGKKLVADQTVILNKQKVKEVIEDNFELFQRRLKLDAGSTVEHIYQVLKNKSTLEKCQSRDVDLFGLTLGYPKNSSLIFNLAYSRAQGNAYKIFENKQSAGVLKKILMSESSPYKDFDNRFKWDLMAQINKINPKVSPEYLKTEGNFYVFNALVEEPSAFNKILSGIRKASSQLAKINEG